MYPYQTTWRPLYTYLPKWASTGGQTTWRKALRDQGQRKKIYQHLAEDSSRISGLIIASTSYGMKVVSKSIAQIASSFGVSSEEAVLVMLEHGGSEVLVFDESLQQSQVEDLLAHPLSVVASDGAGFPLVHSGQLRAKLVHPRCFGTTARFLTIMRQSGRLSLEHAIAKLTSIPAEMWGLQNRGRIEIGCSADLVLFDPLKMRDVATLQNPYQQPAGFHAVWVNGVLAYEHGAVLSSRSGLFLRRGV